METTPVDCVKARACYPPMVESVEILGYIKDTNGIGYSRDIGRSSTLGGHSYYVFGDTFNKNDRDEFVGITSNTVAIVPDRANPLLVKYMDIQKDGMVDALIPLNDSECRLAEQGVRVILWAFGGIAETRPDLGWTWYQVAEVQNNCTNVYHGVGLARICVTNQHDGQLQVSRCKDLVYESPTNRLSDIYLRDLIFGPEEIRFGSFSCLVHNDHVYLWGDRDAKIYLARVSKYKPTSRASYEFWDGFEYVQDWKKAVPVLEDVQHGAFVHSHIFGRDRSWVFVGCTRWADSQVMIGAEYRLEGPWTLQPLIPAEGIDRPEEYMYCMYPHLWAFKEEDGEVLVTWSEHWPGGVVGAKVKLAMAHQSIYWAKVRIDGYGFETRQAAADWAADARALVRDSRVNIVLNGEWVFPGARPLSGTLPLQLLITGTSERDVSDAAYVAKVKLEVLNRLENESTISGEGLGTGRLSWAARWVGNKVRRISSSSKSS